MYFVGPRRHIFTGPSLAPFLPCLSLSSLPFSLLSSALSLSLLRNQSLNYSCFVPPRLHQLVSRTRLFTVGDGAFPDAAARVWNSLQQHVTSSPSVALFQSHVKTHLFSILYHTFYLVQCPCNNFRCFAHDNRSMLLYSVSQKNHPQQSAVF